MKKKMIPHIFAVIGFVVFVMLGLASAAAPRPSESDPLSDGFGRVIVSNSSDNMHFWYVFYREGSNTDENIRQNNPVSVFSIRAAPNVPTSIQEDVRADTTYILRFRQMTQGELREVSTAAGPATREDKRLWNSRTITASNGEVVRISIP